MTGEKGLGDFLEGGLAERGGKRDTGHSPPWNRNYYNDQGGQDGAVFDAVLFKYRTNNIICRRYFGRARPDDFILYSIFKNF